jgi:hypothetical protein
MIIQSPALQGCCFPWGNCSPGHTEKQVLVRGMYPPLTPAGGFTSCENYSPRSYYFLLFRQPDLLQPLGDFQDGRSLVQAPAIFHLQQWPALHGGQRRVCSHLQPARMLGHQVAGLVPRLAIDLPALLRQPVLLLEARSLDIIGEQRLLAGRNCAISPSPFILSEPQSPPIMTPTFASPQRTGRGSTGH